MKNTLFGLVLGCALPFCSAFAADITIYYSPTCPHCHHARDFISSNLIYEYPELKVTTVNVFEETNRPEFMAALEKCKYESGGVPVMVIGEKCFQGYADSMADDVRSAIEADLDDAAKAVAAKNKKALADKGDEFKAAHEDRKSAVVERELPIPRLEPIQLTGPQENGNTAKPTPATKSNDSWVFYVILIALVVGLGFVLTRGNKKK